MSDATADIEVAPPKETTTAVKSFISGGFGGVAAVLVGQFAHMRNHILHIDSCISRPSV